MDNILSQSGLSEGAEIDIKELEGEIEPFGVLEGEISDIGELEGEVEPFGVLEGDVSMPEKEEVVKLANAAKGRYVTLSAASWVSENDKRHSQVVEVKDGTSKSQVDLTPDLQQLEIFYEKDLTFLTMNLGGVVTVYAVGQKPLNDYTIQVTLTEVDVPDGTAIWGITVGTPISPKAIEEKLEIDTLPPVTENDEGKILAVQDGKWTVSADGNRPLSNFEIEKIINSSI